MSETSVQMQGITKSFNQITVLDQVNFEIRPGEIHALLGENGAGKSTLMKILQGVYIADAGEIRIQDRVVHFQSPNDARTNGIAMVFQEFSLIPTLTVAQNVFLTREVRSRFGLVDDRACERQTAALFKEMGVDVNPKATVSQLSTGYRQLTEIATALSQDAHTLILDEPTASLTYSETQALFKIMRNLKERGISMIYISHRMEEIFQIADNITILRDGRHIITEKVANLTIQEVIEHIIGHKVVSVLERKNHAKTDGQPLLEILDLTSSAGVRNVNFSLYAGEILGVVGLMGSGRTELVETLFGLNKIRSGEMRVRGQKIELKRPENSMQARIALIPEDRRRQGLVLNHTLKDNFLLPLIKLGRVSRKSGLVNDRRGNELAEDYVKRLHIRVPSIFRPVRLLSGGNQQKVVIAKWLSTDPEILLMDEPMAGVDIGTKGEIMETVRKLADEGKGIIIISSELPELLAVCDRILVLKKGQVTQELARSEIQTEEKLHHILQGA